MFKVFKQSYSINRWCFAVFAVYMARSWNWKGCHCFGLPGI